MKDKIKKVIIGLLLLLIIMFIVVYIMTLSGYYQSVENKNSILTEEAINRFEKDVLNGKKIKASNYLEKKKRYDNLLSRTGIDIGNIIERIFNKALKLILKEIEGAIK